MFANEVNWKEAAAEFWHGFRHLTPQKVWDWLTYPKGQVPMRLIYAVVIIPLLFWLQGCSTAPLDPIATGTEHAVTVSRINSLEVSNMSRPMTSPLLAAQKHCAQYGKHAQFTGKVDDWTTAYNCVK